MYNSLALFVIRDTIKDTIKDIYLHLEQLKYELKNIQMNSSILEIY